MKMTNTTLPSTSATATATATASTSPNSTIRRKRQRFMSRATAVVAIAVAVCSSNLIDTAEAFTPVTRTAVQSSTRTASSSCSSSTLLAATASSATTLQETTSTTKSTLIESYNDYDLYYYTDNDIDDEVEDGEFDMDENPDIFVEASVPGFKKLQQSTGSEILPQELQAQIDQGATTFLDELQQDATAVEKIAMRSITQQLPQAAVQALSRRRRRSTSTSSAQSSSDSTTTSSTKNNSGTKNNKKSHNNNLNFAVNQRVTPEQEIQLARIIQQGAALHKLRQDPDTGATLTRAAWAERAGLSPKELRRRVSAYRQAKHNLVTANMGLVHAVVNQLWESSSKHRQTGVTKEEMVQEGSLGLLRAAELFDPERGLRFSTYAVVWIKGTLSNTHVSELVRLPQREKTKWNKIMQAQRDILAMNNNNVAGGGGPEEAAAAAVGGSALRVPLEELAAATGLAISDILSTQRHMHKAQQVYSLDFEFKGHSRSGDDATGSTTVASRIKAQEEDLAERTQLQADVLAALARNLDAREGRLMRLRYGLSDGRARTLHECAEAMGLSYTRVHQLASTCLKKLRKAAEVESLEEYLLTIA